jgi:hypothetical protein
MCLWLLLLRGAVVDISHHNKKSEKFCKKGMYLVLWAWEGRNDVSMAGMTCFFGNRRGWCERKHTAKEVP